MEAAAARLSRLGHPPSQAALACAHRCQHAGALRGPPAGRRGSVPCRCGTCDGHLSPELSHSSAVTSAQGCKGGVWIQTGEWREEWKLRLGTLTPPSRWTLSRPGCDSGL